MQTLTAVAAEPKLAAVPRRVRITSIDFVRGLVMVIMALDHVRDFFHIQAQTGDPTDMATTTPILFFTRWITHFCAPTFVFLAGTSAFLSGQRRTKKELSLFLMKRGLWLVLIEVAVVTLAITFNPFYNVIIFQVIWAIGMSMILLGLLVLLPMPLILAIGILIVFGHNVLDYTPQVKENHMPWLWNMSLNAHVYIATIAPGHMLLFMYAFLPWTGVMCLGYCFGSFFRKEVSPEQRRRILLGIGGSAMLLFVLLRYINQYGDPSPWQVQRNGTYTLLSFLNTTKYPPSLLYVLMTLGPSITLVGLLEPVQNKVSQFFITFGRVPFFYYVIHFYLIHLLCVAAFFLTGHTVAEIAPKNSPFFFRPDHFGFSLPVVYLIWMSVIAILYPLVKKYNAYKATHHQWWLSYL